MRKKFFNTIFVFFLFPTLFGCSSECKHNSLIIDSAVAATCTSHGLTEGSHCETCGKTIVPQEIIEPLGHDVVIDDELKATCTKDGKTAGAHCSRCNQILISQNVIGHLGHKVIIDEAIDPTCTNYGLTEGSHCETCGEVLVAQKIVNPLGHDVVIDHRIDATATESGLTEGAHCSRCNEILIKQDSIDPTGYKITIKPNNTDYGYILGTTTQYLAIGEQSTPVTAIPNLGYRFKSWSNGSTDNPLKISINQDTTLTANFEIDSLELPIMEIYTEGKTAIVSKEDYIKCGVSVLNAAFEYEFNNLTGKIKGRGNSTWTMPKKPYKLKFDNKVDLFGNGSAKTWTLIANYCDPSLARNFFAYEVGRLIGSDYCTTTQCVELYLNGTYQGVYLVCEQNEVATNRVEIDESYTDLNTGYFLELDARAPDEGEENKDWFSFQEKAYAIKSPDPEEELFSIEFVNYIKQYLSDSFDAILSKNIENILCYIDIDSFAKSYIVNEVLKCFDVGNCSFYLFKDKNGKLKSGPLWDFDISSGNYNYGIPNPGSSYAVFRAKETNPWYKKLLLVPEFKALVAKYLNDYYIEISKTINDSVTYLKANRNAFERNFQKWDILGKYVWPNPDEIVAIDTWEGQVDYLRDWVLKSLDFIYNYYIDCVDDAYSVAFDNNDECSIEIFNTNDLNNSTIVLNNAWSRDEFTGELRNDGTGQTIFKVNIENGYSIDTITIDNPYYSEIITLDEENHIYQIVDITGNINVVISLKDNEEPPEPIGYNISFQVDDGSMIMVYSGKDYSIDGDIVTSTVVEDMSGDGQLNFRIILPDGYETEEIVITGSYKNLKGPEDTGAANVYRVTKVASDLIILIRTRPAI